MDSKNLKTLHQLCPTISKINLSISPLNLSDLKTLLDFNDLTQITFQKTYEKFRMPPFIDFLESFKEKKIQKITFPSFKTIEESFQFHEALFENTSLTEFDGMNPCTTEEDLKLISSWIEKNSNLKILRLDCILFQLIKSET
jgi:hypothetical protein